MHRFRDALSLFHSLSLSASLCSSYPPISLAFVFTFTLALPPEKREFAASVVVVVCRLLLGILSFPSGIFSDLLS